MMSLINKILGYSVDKAETPKGFSGFFTDTDSAEKKKILKQVVKKANKDQKELVEKYDREFSRV